MSTSLEQVDRALAAWRFTRSGEPREMAAAVLSDAFEIDTDRGRVFLRVAQPRRTLAIVEAENRAIAFAGDAGIPVARPFSLPSGDSAVDIDGRVASLYPFVPGRNAVRRSITEGEARSLGDMHGRVQRALAGYADPALDRPSGETKWDLQASLANLYRVESLVSADLRGVDDRHVRRALRYQLMLLESGIARPSADFADLPVQIEHGDFHERNVLLAEDGDDVRAVVDWERVRPLPRTFQVFRAIDFMGMAASPLAGVYAAAFGAHMRFGRDEIERSAEFWWQSNLHNTWIYTEVFEAGNTRATQFLYEVENRLRQLSDVGFRQRLAGLVAAGCGE
jgi:Ser/Thr protein kinase RdoA (MazF antagonist)